MVQYRWWRVNPYSFKPVSNQLLLRLMHSRRKCVLAEDERANDLEPYTFRESVSLIGLFRSLSALLKNSMNTPTPTFGWHGTIIQTDICIQTVVDGLEREITRNATDLYVFEDVQRLQWEMSETRINEQNQMIWTETRSRFILFLRSKRFRCQINPSSSLLLTRDR